MAWTWRMTTAQVSVGTVPPGDAPAAVVAEDAADGDPGRFGAPASGFSSQADAETWLGTVWRELASDGVSAASLYEEDRLVYGPMSLEPG